MDTFLFAWNPKKWTWQNDVFSDRILSVAERGWADDSWSSGNRTSLPTRSRFFLIRLGKKPCGIVGSGITLSEPEFGSHWNPVLRRKGKEVPYVDLRFNVLSREPLISWEELQKPPFSEIRWGIQASGVLLPEPLAKALENVWRRRTKRQSTVLPEELPQNLKFHEGAKKTVTVNIYERDPRARAACIAHFGVNCAVCGLRLEKRYGPIARDFIHVHHTIPLSTVTAGYRVNPKKDLCPVCPNCHSIIHLRVPPLSIKDARRLIRK